MIPFFVVDRPISLEIIKGLKVPHGKKIGLMAHANTSPQFREAFREYPHRQVVKMCDSAIFNMGGYKNGYEELFKTYEEMGTDYGVMIDVFRNSRATIESARKGLAAYDPAKYHFKLVGVAQGKTIEEYLDCYKQLKEMGFEYIAVGGLLHKVEKSARYAYVRDEDLMSQVLKRIKEEFEPDWLFALGCLHPARLELFKELDVWGDYKGWIFEYQKRDESLQETIEQFSANHLEHAPAKFQASATGIAVKEALARRREALSERNKAHAALLEAKKSLKNRIVSEVQSVRKSHPKLARVLESFKSRGLLKDSEPNRIVETLRRAEVSKKRRDQLLAIADESRSCKTALVKTERKLEARNKELGVVLRRFAQSKSAGKKLVALATKILKVLDISEQAHRIKQVHIYIESQILKQL